jgi:hypothetical protein
VNQRVGVGGQDQRVALRPRTPATATEALEERRDGARGVNLDDAVEVTHVDTQLKGRGRDDDAVPRSGEPLLGSAPLVDRQRRV